MIQSDNKERYDSKNNRQCVLLLINIWKQIISYDLNYCHIYLL